MEETLNDCGYENSGIIIGEDRLVHYVRRGESNYTEDVLGEEATRNGVLVRVAATSGLTVTTMTTTPLPVQRYSACGPAQPLPPATTLRTA